MKLLLMLALAVAAVAISNVRRAWRKSKHEAEARLPDELLHAARPVAIRNYQASRDPFE